MGAQLMRFQDWPERLNKIIEESHDKPFAWGEHDCCIFAANVIKAITGVDHADHLRGTYSTATEAVKVLKGVGGVKGIASSTLCEEVHPMTAQRGDIVMIHSADHGDTLAVCLGAYCVAPGVDRLQTSQMGDAVAAWRVK